MLTPPTPKVIAYTDGAASGNPGPAGWGVVCVRPDGESIELGGGESRATNNQMEIRAAIEALQFLKTKRVSVSICTDSSYLILGILNWVHGWKKRKWKTAEGKDVANQDLWKELSALVEKFPATIEWFYVPGHAGVPGNERADAIAVGFSKGDDVSLGKSHLDSGALPKQAVPGKQVKPHSAQKPKTPHSYLSLVGGRPARHRSWADCESRVKGVTGAKFKKAMTPSQEAEILAEWGCDPNFE